MLSQKRRQYFVYWRAFWQRRCRAAAAGAVLKPTGANYAVLSLQFYRIRTRIAASMPRSSSARVSVTSPVTSSMV